MLLLPCPYHYLNTFPGHFKLYPFELVIKMIGKRTSDSLDETTLHEGCKTRRWVGLGFPALLVVLGMMSGKDFGNCRTELFSTARAHLSYMHRYRSPLIGHSSCVCRSCRKPSYHLLLRSYMGLNPSGAVVLQMNVIFDYTAQRIEDIEKRFTVH